MHDSNGMLKWIKSFVSKSSQKKTNVYLIFMWIGFVSITLILEKLYTDMIDRSDYINIKTVREITRNKIKSR